MLNEGYLEMWKREIYGQVKNLHGYGNRWVFTKWEVCKKKITWAVLR
jgi:hypothetical protein